MKLSFIKYSLIVMLITGLTFAQDIYVKQKKEIRDKDVNVKIENYNSSELIKETENRDIKADDITLNFFRVKKDDKFNFDFISSVGSNISFGGIWDKYAVLNFTPQMYIKPLSFISIYGSNSLNCFIPIAGIKEYFQSITIQGLAVLAIDNSMKILFPSSQWIPQLISFAAKNFLINFVIKPSIERSINTETPMLEYNNFYYSVSINF